jgi:hypothetical protein
MKIPSVAWAFFALTVLLVGWHWHYLRNGILVGARVRVIERPYGEAYLHICRYLYVNGIREVVNPQVVIATREKADEQFCPPTPQSN